MKRIIKDMLLLLVFGFTLAVGTLLIPGANYNPINDAWIVKRDYHGVEVYLTWITTSPGFRFAYMDAWTPKLKDAWRFADRIDATQNAIRYDGTAIPITEAKR